jgi:hypothetical protein
MEVTMTYPAYLAYPKCKLHARRLRNLLQVDDRQASVEIGDNDDDIQQYPAGPPKNPTAIIEAADGSDDDLPQMAAKETAEEELGEYEQN